MRRIVYACAALTLALTACAGGASSKAGTAAPTTTAKPAATAVAPTTTQPKPRYLVATAKPEVTEVPIFDKAGDAEATRSLPNPEPYYGTPRVFLVQGQEGDWLLAFLPMRPNGTQGWIRASDVVLSSHDYHMEIDLAEHQIVVYNRDEVIMQEPIGEGTAATPTPGGLFYTTWLWSRDDQPEYGPYAFGLSGYSEVYYSFGAGDGQFAIHGTNDPSSVGRSVSHGCIRLNNDAITKLAETLPSSGVPVEIKA